MTDLNVSPRTLADLDWPRLARAVAGAARTEAGRKRLTAPVFEADPVAVKAALDAVEEARTLIRLDRAPDPAGAEDVTTIVRTAEKGGTLDAAELFAVAQLLRAARRARTAADAARRAGAELPLWYARLDAVPEVPALENALDRGFDAQGRVTDAASPELARLRREVRRRHEHIKTRIEGYLNGRDIAHALQDDFYTVRDERYVLPVKVSYKREIPGILHGTSQTGQTVYVEPQDLVDANNELRLAEMEVERELRRILREWTELLAAAADAVPAVFEALCTMDVLLARARFADALDGAAPRIVADGPSCIDFRRARHPLLEWSLKRPDGDTDDDFRPPAGGRTIANDIAVGDGPRMLVVTGPNTGGKTVVLKTAGLLALMVQSGLPVPADAASVFTPFDTIACDLGDEQDLSGGLSTFSANILNLDRMLKAAGPRTLLLLDEIIVGTEPVQGASLAAAVLEAFAAKGAIGVVTTHYDRLKQIAFGNPLFENASVALDPRTGRPTYSLTRGVPGTSNAFRVARALGFDATVVDRAEALLSGEERRIEDELARLEALVAEFTAKRDDIELLRERVEKERAAVKTREDELHREALRLENERRRDRKKAYAEAREEAAGLLRAAQAAAGMQKLGIKEAQALVEEMRTLERAVPAEVPLDDGPSPPRGGAPLGRVGAGDAVWVRGFARDGRVVEGPDRHGNVLVEVGRVKTRVAMSELFAPGGPDRSLPTAAGGVIRRDREDVGRYEGGVLTLDLRGERVEDAVTRTETFLDRAYESDAPFVYIVHGHGTGALKRSLREHLMNSRYVKSIRAGGRGEGGDGTTVVTLRGT